MTPRLGRRAFLQGLGALLAFGLAGCAGKEQETSGDEQALDEQVLDEQAQEEQTVDVSQSGEDDPVNQEDEPMQITITVNGTPFTATIENNAAGQELLARLPLTLSMEELHGNEKYCYTGKAFGGEQYVPDTIEAGDLMVFGSDCLVLFYETFSNGGWSYARVGKIDDPSGLAEACGSGTASVEFA